ncbi:MAG: aspartate aminotransferase family protein [Balneolaceae bacterium]
MKEVLKNEFDIAELIEQRRNVKSELYSEYVNPRFAKAMQIIGFNRNYVKGEGSYLWDDKGTKYLDFVSGFGMFNIGRNHPVIKKTIQDYMDLNDVWKTSMSVTDLPGLLAEALIKKAPHLDKVFFSNSGTESVEAALKFARSATKRETIVYCEKAFHGLTYGSLSVNGSKHFREGFSSMLPGPVSVPLNDVNALRKVFSEKKVAGVIIEPVLGKGVYPADFEFLLEIQNLCRKNGALMIADEIQTGLGRTGKFFSFQHVAGLEPDMILVSKSLSGGMVPVGAVLMRNSVYDKVFSSLDRCVVHSSTFGGGGLPMACGLATLYVLENENLIENAAHIGNYLLEKLKELTPEYEFLKEIRGQGLMIGIEFGKPKSLGLRAAWKMIHTLDKNLFPQAVTMPLLGTHHILTQVTGHNQDIVKLLPTLNITKADADWFLDAFKETLDNLHRIGGPVWETAKHLSPFATGKKVAY